MQGAQFSAVSTTAENQMLSTSMYIHSIPNNNDNQDIVSMGTNAANTTRTVINNAYEVLAVEVMTIIQALRYLEFNGALSGKTKKKVVLFKDMIPDLKEDIPLSGILENVRAYIRENDAYEVGS